MGYGSVAALPEEAGDRRGGRRVLTAPPLTPTAHGRVGWTAARERLPDPRNIPIRGGPMTHSIDTPFPPPAPVETAVQAGGQVASTATDQAKEVVQETQRQAKDLLDQGRTQVREQAISQQQKAGQSLTSLAQEL